MLAPNVDAAEVAVWVVVDIGFAVSSPSTFCANSWAGAGWEVDESGGDGSREAASLGDLAFAGTVIDGTSAERWDGESGDRGACRCGMSRGRLRGSESWYEDSCSWCRIEDPTA